jgi:hypothetical protein
MGSASKNHSGDKEKIQFLGFQHQHHREGYGKVSLELNSLITVILHIYLRDSLGMTFFSFLLFYLGCPELKAAKTPITKLML